MRFDFRKRTSCAADHVVIEMLGELASDIWETIASCFQFRLMNHWTEDTESVWKTHLFTMVKKKHGKLTMRGFSPIAMLPTIYLALLDRRCSNWRGGALQSRRGPQYGHVPGRQAHEVVWMLTRVVGTGYVMANSGFRDRLRRCCGVLITSHTTESSRQRWQWRSRRC